MSAPATPREIGAEPLDSAALREAQVAELGMAFRRVFRSLSRLRGRDTHLAGAELSHAQFELLIELHERGALSAGELAAAARLSPGTVTQMLEHLADGGPHLRRRRGDKPPVHDCSRFGQQLAKHRRRNIRTQPNFLGQDFILLGAFDQG